MTTHYDAIIVGGGKAGKTLAMDLAKAKKKVAMIEEGMIGGTCINVACIPTKALVASAKVAHIAKKAGDFGVEVKDIKLDFPKIKARKQAIVNAMRDMNLKMFLDSGMDLFIGKGTFIGPKKLEITLSEPRDGQKKIQISGEQIFINTGALPFIPPIPGLKEVGALTNAEIMELDTIPKQLLIMGGGYIGLEFAQMFRRFGSEVTIIERSPTFLPAEDRDVADAVKQILEDEGIKILLNYEILRAEGNPEKVTLVLRDANQNEIRVDGSKLLVSVGRIPNTQDLNLTATNVKTDQRGFIEVNEFLETSAENIYALGDVKGGPQFTHLSLDDYRIMKYNLAHPEKKRSTQGRYVPYTVFIDPELARIGLTETQALAQGYQIKIAKLPVAAIPRAKTLGETKGMIKIIIDAKTDKMLGGAILATEGGEVMASLEIAILADLTFTFLKDGMYAHPTIVEGFNQLVAV